jgi:hypothetical protein
MAQACVYLRPDDAANVQVIEAAGGEAELRLQLRGYLAGGTDKSIPAPTDLIAKHIFDHLRGTDNLVFAGSRQSVEIYADRCGLCARTPASRRNFILTTPAFPVTIAILSNGGSRMANCPLRQFVPPHWNWGSTSGM